MTTQDTDRTARVPPTTPAPASVVKPAALPPARPRQLTIPPPDPDELEEGYARRPPGAFAPEQAIDDQIGDLEAWALANIRKESRENTRLWFLRGFGFLGGVSAATGGALHLAQMAVIGGGVAALAVAIDAAWPVTSDRHARRRAIHDLRELQHTLKLKWDKVRLAYPDPHTPKRIAHALTLLDATHAKREEISKYLGDEEPGVTRTLAR